MYTYGIQCLFFQTQHGADMTFNSISDSSMNLGEGISDTEKSETDKKCIPYFLKYIQA